MTIALLPAARAEVRLDGIVVSGTTLENDAAGGIPTERIGSPVAVVTGQQLRASKVRHAGDALRGLPGVHVSSSGGFGSPTQIRIRGAEGNHTLVLIDGIEANDTVIGEFDFSDLLVDDIERIEVIRGGYSGIYGSKAIGGVINIVTKSGRGPITARVTTEGGSFGTFGTSARVSGGTDKVWLSGVVQTRKSDGFNIAPRGDEADPWRMRTLGLKGGFRPLAGVQVDFTLRHSRKFAHFDQELLNPATGLNEATDTPNTSTSDVFLGGAKLRWDLFDGAFTQVLKTTHNRSQLDSSTLFGDTQNLSMRSRYGYLATYKFATPMLLSAKHTISGLIEQESESFTPRTSYTDGLERKRERIAGVVSYRGEILRRFHFAATLRHDDNKTFRDFTTWRTSLSVPLPEFGIRPHASVGTSAALPGMFEQYGLVLGTFVGNPNLVPEESFGWDVGMEFTLPNKRSSIDITYFRANLENEIRGFGDTLINLAGESRRSGVEVAFKSRLTHWLNFAASYTYLDATEPDGAQEIRRPRHSGKATLTAKFHEGRGTFNVSAIYNGLMKDLNFGTFPATRVTLDDYLLVNAAVSYKLKPGVELFARMENILDQNYQEISGYASPGIAAYAGLRIKYVDPTTANWAQYR